MNRTILHSYDKDNNLILKKKIDGTILLEQIWENNLLIKEIKYNKSYQHGEHSTITNYIYNDKNLLIMKDFPLGSTIYKYDNNNNLILEENSGGNFLKYKYNDNNKLIKKIDSLWRHSNFYYNNDNNMIKESYYIEDKKILSILYSYRENNIKIGIMKYTNNNDYFEIKTYQNDLLLSVETSNSEYLSYEYDHNNNLMKKKYPSGNTIEYINDYEQDLDNYLDIKLEEVNLEIKF